MDCKNNTLQSDTLMSGDSFPFESEAMPLKGNTDYIKLRQCLITLESMRIQALKDIDRLYELQDEALADPFSFVSKLQKGEDVGIPNRLTPPEIPEIDWSKYKIQFPLDTLRPITRPKAGNEPPGIEKPTTSGTVVRGRVRDESKSSTFNQLWTPEEQIRLEELLIKYPPEESESRRFAKIAKALGNRTLSQVTSRCQKYFLKLHKAGLPVPGRPPRRPEMVRNPKSKSAWSSSFFPRTQPPVAMREEGDMPGTSSVRLTIKEEPESEDSGEYSDNARNSDDFRKLVLLRRVKKDITTHGTSSQVLHSGFKCDICNDEPIRGTRWHCVECGNDEGSIDFCSSCLISQLEGESPHSLDHHFVACRNGSEFSNNYLYVDPNFLPE